MKKLTAFILLILMVFPLLASCEKPETATKAESNPTSSLTGSKTAEPTAGAKTVIYVSPNGDDANDGTKNAPVKSFGAAFAKAAAASGDTDVIFASGHYFIDSTVTFPADSCSGRQLNFIGADGAVLTGGVYFTAADFEPLSGDFSGRFPEDARENIVMLDLTKHGFDADAMYSLNCSDKTVYYNGTRMTLSRYPNLKDGVRDSVYLRTADTEEADDGYIFKVPRKDAPRVASWAEPDEVEIFGMFYYLWGSSHEKIGSYDPSTRKLFIEGNLYTGVRDGQPYCFNNIPEELDTAGEFYISKDGILYIVKPDGFDTGVVSIPVTKNMFVFDGASGISFDNLRLECTTGLVMSGTASGFTLKNCEIRDIENVLDITGTNNVIDSCEIHEITKSGITMKGGDKYELTPSGCVITNCDLHDWDIASDSYVGMLTLNYAIGAVVSHCKIHDSCWGVGGAGLLGVWEYNEFYNTNMYTDDIGCTGAGGHEEMGGIIRYNYIHDIGKKSVTDLGCAAFYCDNCSNGGTAYGNVIDNIAGLGFLIGGGRGFDIHDNIVMNTSKVGYCYDERGISWEERGIRHAWDIWMDFGHSRYFTAPKWVEQFPFIANVNIDPEQTDKDDPGYPGNPADSKLYNNIYVMNGRESGIYNALSDENKLIYQYDVEPRVYQYSEVEPLCYIATDIMDLTASDLYDIDLPDGIDIDLEAIGIPRK